MEDDLAETTVKKESIVVSPGDSGDTSVRFFLEGSDTHELTDIMEGNMEEMDDSDYDALFSREETASEDFDNIYNENKDIMSPDKDDLKSLDQGTDEKTIETGFTVTEELSYGIKQEEYKVTSKSDVGLEASDVEQSEDTDGETSKTTEDLENVLDDISNIITTVRQKA